MYIRIGESLGQKQLPSTYNTPCLQDEVPLEFILLTDRIIEKKLDRFNYRQSNLRTWHKTWIRRRLAPRIVRSWRTSRPIRTVILVGHSDEIGEARDNYKLGKARALAVLKELQIQIKRRRPGLSGKIKFETYSSGECWPLKPGGKRDRRNRRVYVYAFSEAK